MAGEPTATLHFAYAQRAASVPLPPFQPPFILLFRGLYCGPGGMAWATAYGNLSLGYQWCGGYYQSCHGKGKSLAYPVGSFIPIYQP